MYINAQEGAVRVLLAPGCGAVREFAWEAKPASRQLLPRCRDAGLAFRANATNDPVNIILPKYQSSDGSSAMQPDA
jgi:hypothetical protein